MTEISAFLSSETLESLSEQGRNPERRELFDQLKAAIFLKIGRVPRYELAFGAYPEYLELHHELMAVLFQGQYALSGKWTYYLAFMAAAAHQCEYFMSLEKELCVLSGGDTEWFDIQTIDRLPEKLKIIGPINVKLAHKPWELTSEDLRLALATWSVSELAEALVVLSAFHSLSSFVLGLGVRNEYDLCPPRMRKLSESEALLHIHKPETTAAMLQQAEHTEEPISEEAAIDFFQLFAGGSLVYVTYTSQAHRLYPSDFNWRDHGYAVLEKLLPQMASKVNALREYVYHLTTDSPRWRAVWIYTQRLYGLEYDDYNYSEVNTVLIRATKAYLKKVACTPHTVRVEDWSGVDLCDFDKLTLTLLISEARREGELLYALHALRDALQSL